MEMAVQGRSKVATDPDRRRGDPIYASGSMRPTARNLNLNRDLESPPVRRDRWLRAVRGTGFIGSPPKIDRMLGFDARRDRID